MSQQHSSRRAVLIMAAYLLAIVTDATLNLYGARNCPVWLLVATSTLQMHSLHSRSPAAQSAVLHAVADVSDEGSEMPCITH
jgi:hypothetical protein